MGSVARTKLDQDSILAFDEVALMEWVRVSFWNGWSDASITGQYEGLRRSGRAWLLLIATRRAIRMEDVKQFRRLGYVDSETGEIDEFIGPNDT